MNQRAEEIRNRLEAITEEMRGIERQLNGMAAEFGVDEEDRTWRGRAAAKVECTRQVLMSAVSAVETAYDLDIPEADARQSA